MSDIELVGEGSQDAAALPTMIDALRARCYTFATVREYVENALPSARRTFPETGHTIANTHGFLSFWQRQGGLPVFGFPLTEVSARLAGVTARCPWAGKDDTSALLVLRRGQRRGGRRSRVGRGRRGR